MPETIFFYIFAITAIVSAIFVVFQRDPVRSALFLVVCFFQVAGLFILLRSPFLAAVQVFVYVGAVIVLFLFVVMVLELRKEKVLEYLHIGHRPWVFLLVMAILLEVGYFLSKVKLNVTQGIYTEKFLIEAGSTEVLGKLIFTKYILPFELVSIILLVALIGAVALVKKKLITERN
ncbi:MAG: NADH-quinone oxidoreductase subunit J [Thermodesulfobacteriota bacterium]